MEVLKVGDKRYINDDLSFIRFETRFHFIVLTDMTGREIFWPSGAEPFLIEFEWAWDIPGATQNYKGSKQFTIVDPHNDMPWDEPLMCTWLDKDKGVYKVIGEETLRVANRQYVPKDLQQIYLLQDNLVKYDIAIHAGEFSVEVKRIVFKMPGVGYDNKPFTNVQVVNSHAQFASYTAVCYRSKHWEPIRLPIDLLMLTK